jgi:hypothetical protein
MDASARPDPSEYAPYFARYIDLVPGDARDALATQIDESLATLRAVSAADSLFRYGPGKWSLREVVGHLIDSERIFAYRALRFARGQAEPIPGFEPDQDMAVARFEHREWPDLLDELRSVRAADVRMLRGLDDAAWLRQGVADGKVMSVRAAAFTIAGHERHHMRIVREKYLEGNGMGSVQTASVEPRNGQADFDFLIGSWKVHNRRLERPLESSSAWYEFEGTSVARKVWGGHANQDEYYGQAPSGPIRGLTLRLYEPSTRQWRLYWANEAKGVLDPPMVGAFQNGRGEFFSHELFEGRGVYVRYVWSDVTPTSCRWEQAFSADGGRIWETNWIMAFTRVEP